MIGTFCQPNLVITDMIFLKSLPKREMICGYAEILKHALINDKKFGRLIMNTSKKNSLEVKNNQLNNKVNIPDDIWIEATTQQHKKITQFIVHNSIKKSDATRLKVQEISGKEKKLQLILVDKADKSSLVSTKFNIIYSVTYSDPWLKPVSDYSTKYRGEIPSNLVTLNGSKFTINVGELPIDSKYLQSGLGVKIKLIINRNFAGYADEQVIIFKDTIGTFK